MPSLADSGSQTTVASTEHTLSTQTTVGVFDATLDLNALSGSNTLIVRLYAKARSGDTERLAMERAYQGATLLEPIVKVPPMVNQGGDWKLTIECSAAISIPWAVGRLDA